jgi:sodium transport system permease protein
MKALRHVFAKEALENLRDRRTLMSALVFGPLFGPVLFAVMISFVLSQAVSSAERKLELPVIGAEHAPNLVDWLARNGAEIVAGPADLDAARRATRAGELDVVLVIPDDYADAFTSGRPARVQIVGDQSSQRTSREIRRAENLVQAYSAEIRALRLSARGVNPMVLSPVQVDEIDVSTPTGRSVLLLGMITYFLLFSMLMGGLYLAIDATAGERERGSLEPLLTLPVRRGELILGKIAAACLYMLLSLAITLAAFSISLGFVPLEKLGMSANFGPGVALAAFGVMAPFVLLGASLMTVVASFTKSYKEAQTDLSFLLLVPTLPILAAALLSLKPSLPLMAVPSLSQHLLVTSLMKDEPFSLADAALSVGTTLALGAAAAWLATRLYRREGLMG